MTIINLQDLGVINKAPNSELHIATADVAIVTNFFLLVTNFSRFLLKY